MELDDIDKLNSTEEVECRQGHKEINVPSKRKIQSDVSCSPIILKEQKVSGTVATPNITTTTTALSNDTPAGPSRKRCEPKYLNIALAPITDLSNDAPGPSGTLYNYFKRSLDCPICFKTFPYDSIENHATLCASKFDTGFDLIISDDELVELVDDELEDTFPYTDGEVVAPSVEIKDIVLDIKDVIMKLKGNNVKQRWLKIRRKKCWDDYINYLKKDWMKNCDDYLVEFIGEAGVDTGGPKREFFSGNLHVFYFIRNPVPQICYFEFKKCNF